MKLKFDIILSKQQPTANRIVLTFHSLRMRINGYQNYRLEIWHNLVIIFVTLIFIF